MLLETLRFGTLTTRADSLIVFPEGLLEMRQRTAWALFSEPSLWWLQSVEEASLAFPLVNPFHYFPQYRPHLSTADRDALKVDQARPPLLLAIARRTEGFWTLNLREPILLRLDLRLGRQISAAGEYSARHLLPASSGIVRKCA